MTVINLSPPVTFYSDVCGGNRSASIVLPRQLAMSELRRDEKDAVIAQPLLSELSERVARALPIAKLFGWVYCFEEVTAVYRSKLADETIDNSKSAPL